MALTGEIYSFTVVHEPPSTHEGWVPYVMALVKVNVPSGRQRLMTMRVTDLDLTRTLGDQIQIGDQVEVVTRQIVPPSERGVIVYGYTARQPLEPASEEWQGEFRKYILSLFG
ncbi:hypothetical protein A2783_05735 [Microgenomates group bacterium RIFCSPHIGHO2_01_FULL_45_11]|nr:MAG: hypothetical protein A2783_05735 [Microgenomates group bacterium RIFCSPHIGHO2_01_FULL_45_11]